MEYTIRYTSDHLEHHGILGQKWGVRRFQNPDGTWTAAGKRRYAKEIKRSLDKQHAKEFRAVMTNDWDAVHNLHRNERELRKRVADEAQKSEEAKALSKASQKIRNRKDVVINESDYKAYNKANSAYNKKLSDLFDKYNDDILGAKLKDIGFEDTLAGREEIRILLADTEWFNDFKRLR